MIIWLASYPKSGNTLLRSMLTAYLFEKEGIFKTDLLKKIKNLPSRYDFEKLGVNLKDHNEIIKNSIKAQETFNKKESIGFVKTHNMLFNFNGRYPFTNFENSLGVIYIVRDPRNVVLSYARHLNKSIEETVKFVTQGKAHGISIMGNWAENYLSWKAFEQQNKYLLIKYEDLVTNQKKTFSKILNFIFKLRNLNLSLDENKINNVIKTTSFENLQNLEKKNLFSENMEDKQGNKIVFFDQGSKRDWSKSLDKNLSKEIEKTFNKEMTELGYL